MVMEDGRCLLDVINDPQALNEFMQNDDLSGNGQAQQANTEGGTQHTFMASPVQNSNQSTNENQGNVVMATGSYGHLVQKTTQSIAPHQGQNVLQLATSQAFGGSAPLQSFQVPQGTVLSQGNVVVQPGSFVQGTVSNGSSGSQGVPAPNRTLQPQFRTSIVQQNAPQQRNAAGQQVSSFQAAFEKAMLANKANNRQASPQTIAPQQNQPLVQQNLSQQQAVAQQPNLNQPILQQNSQQQVLQQPISQQHLQQTFSQQPLQQNISQQPLQQNISQQSVQQSMSQQSGVVQTMNSGSVQQNVVGQGGTKTISSLQALHNLNIVSHPSVQSSSVTMAMPTVSTATVAASGQRTIHIQPKPPVAISPKLLPASSRPLVNISPKTSLPGSQTVLLQGANAQGVAPNINIANLVTLPGLRAPQGVLVQAQSLAQRISNVQRVPITTQASVTQQQQPQQQTASPQTNILLQAAQQSNLMPPGPVQNVIPSSGTPQGTPQSNVLQQHGVTLVQRASPGVASIPQQQQQSLPQHTVPLQIAPQSGNLQAPVYITTQSSPSPANLQPAQAQQLRPATSQQTQPASTTSRTNLAALSIAQQIQDQAAAQSRSGQAAIIPQNLLQKGAKILPANVAQQLLQQRKLSDQSQGAAGNPQIVAVNTSQPASTVTTVTMTTVQTSAVQHTVTTTSSQPQVLVTTGAGGQPRLIVTLPQQPLPPQFQQREEKNMQLYQQALRIQKERQLQPGTSGQIAGTTIVTTQIQSGQQQGLLVQQQGIMGQQQGMMGQVTSAGNQQTIQLSTTGQGSGGQQNFIGQQVLSGIVQQHGIMGQQQGIVGQQQGIGGQVQQSIVGQQQGIVGQQQGIGVQLQQSVVGQQQQGIVGQQQQGVVSQQLQGIMGQQQQSVMGQHQQQGVMGQQQQQGMVAQQQQRMLGQQQQSLVGQQQGIVGQQQGIMGQQQQDLVRQQLNIVTPSQASSNQQSPAKAMAPRPITVSSPQQPIVTRAAGQAQSSGQNPTGVTVVRQPVTLNVQQGKQFITLTLQQQQHLAAIQAKLRTIVTPGKQLSPQEKQVVQQLQVLQSRILQQAKAQTQALAQNAAGQASLAQAAQKMTPIAQKPAAPGTTQAQGQGTIQQQRQQLNELLKTQTQVIRTTQGSGVTGVVSGSTSAVAGQPTLVKLQTQGAQGPAAVIQLTPQQKATLQQIQQQLKTLSPQQQQQFLKQQQHLILQLKNSKIAISPAALSAANAGNTVAGVAGQQQLVTVLKQQPGQTIAGKLVQSAVQGIKRPAPQPMSKTDLIKNKGKLDQQGCLKPDYKTPFRNKEDAIKRLLPFHIHMTRDIEDKEIDKAEVMLDTVSQSLVEKYHKMRDKYHHLLLQESMRTDPSAEMVMLWRIFVHEEKSALAQEKKLAVEGANGTPVAVPSASISQEPTEPPAAVPSVVGTATTAYLQPTAPTNTFPKSATTVTSSRSLTTSTVIKPHTSTGQGRSSTTTQVVVPVAKGGAVAMETKEPDDDDDEESEEEVDLADTVGSRSAQPTTSYLNMDSSSIVDAVKATSPARLKSESEMAVASLLGEDSVDIDILNSDIANSDLPEDPGVDAVRSLTGAFSPTRNVHDDAANDFEDDSDEEPDSLNEQVQSAINSILELQGRGPMEEEDSPQDIFNPFSQDPPCSASSEPNIDEDNALDEAVKSILF